ncbi:MAG TPA: PilZ domain-containing protein [Fimbriimonadaceae bacterium]|nr:PilZ domain-containing protein [Fimbriimonadaceae bacterium]
MSVAATQGVPKMKDANLFIQTRARLQRLGDMKFFTGWVEAINHAQVRIRIKGTKAVIARGDRFSVEVAGKEQTAAFIGEVTEIAGPAIELILPRGLALLPKKENARVSMFGVKGRILFEGSEYAVTVMDISESGIGVVSNSNLERGTNVDFEVFTPIGSVHGTGEVRYCRADPDTPNQFRAGILVSSLDRIERARWNQLLNSTLTP